MKPRKPLDYQLGEIERRAKIDGTDSQLAKAGHAIWETFKNPILLNGLLSEQIPQLVALGVAGRVAGTAAAALGKTAQVASKVASATGIATGAGLQGADVAGSVYNEMLALPEEMWAQNPEYQTLVAEVGPEEAKHQISLRNSQLAFAAAAGVSTLTQVGIPGGSILAKTAAGAQQKLGKSVVANTAAGFVGESAQEAAEEGFGQLIGNVAKSTINTGAGFTGRCW